MAKMPPASKTAAPMADDQDDEDTGTDAGEDTSAGDDSEDEGASDKPQVLLTVLLNSDGSFTLVHGDEDEGEGESGEEDESAGADETDEGQPPAGEEAEPEEGEESGDESAESAEGPAQEHFSSPGELLHGILKLLQGQADGGAAQDHFEKGFSEDSAPSPKY